MQFLTLIRLKSIKHFHRVIVACFSILLILMLILSASNYYNLSSFGSRLSEVVNENNEKSLLINNLRDIARERLILLHRIVQETDPFVIDDHVIKHKILAGEFVRLRRNLDEKLTDSSEIRELEKLKQELKVAQPAQSKVIELVLDRQRDLAEKALEEAIVSQEQVIKHLETFAAIQNKYSRELSNSTEQDLQQSFYLLLVITSFVIVFAGLTSWFVIRVIAAKNNELMQVNMTNEYANRSLTIAIENAIHANKAKSEFIANMSHELRTPMTSIRGALGMLNSGMVENIPEDAKTMINIADTNSERLMELISDVLDFSNFEAGELEMINREFTVKEELEKVLIPHTSKSKQKGLELKVHYEPCLPVRISTDLEHVKHIVNQLMNNAIKFTEMGSIEITLDFAANKKHLLVKVKDTGIGIHEGEISRIFENFVQGDGSSTRKYGGTGIGLSICKKLVDALGGEIGVDSEPGRGSVFWFSIPVELKQEAA